MAHHGSRARRRCGLPSGAGALRRSGVRRRWSGIRRRWHSIRRCRNCIRGRWSAGIRGPIAGRSGPPRRRRTRARRGLRCCRSGRAFLQRFCRRRSWLRLNGLCGGRCRWLRLNRRGSGPSRRFWLNRSCSGRRRGLRRSRRRRCRRRGGMRRRCGCRRLMRRGRCWVWRRRRSRRRGGLWWRRCGVRRRRGLGRCRVGWRCLWRFFRLWLSVRTDFGLCLRHNQRSGLGVRRRACELYRRKGRRSEQNETKFCHDGLSPRKIIDNTIR
jgi:hypothetical protein